MAKNEQQSKPKVYSYPQNVSKETYDEMFEAWLDSSGQELTATKIHNTLSQAFEGYSRDQASVFRNVIEKEIMIGAHLQTRKLAVSGLPWNVVGGSDEKNKQIETIFNTAGINDLMNHLLEASGMGYSGAFIQWGRGGGTILDFPTIDHGNWEFDEFGNPYLVDISGVRNSLESYNKNNIVYHNFNAKSGIPSTRGLCRTLIWTYFFKLFAFRHKARYLEKYGIPFILSKLSAKDFADDDTRSEIKANLRNIGADGVGVFTEGTEVTSLNVGAQGTNADFQGWLNYLDGTIAMLILGQVASSGPAGGLGSDGQVQDNVRRDLIRSDAKGLQETINNSVLRPLEFFKYGTKELEFILDAEPPADLAQKATVLTGLQPTIAASGKQVDPEWIEKTFTVPLIDLKPIEPPPAIPGVLPTEELPGRPIETDDNPKDAVAFDESVDQIINTSALPPEIQQRIIGKTAKEVVAILNTHLISLLGEDDVKKNDTNEVARVRNAIDSGVDSVLFEDWFKDKAQQFGLNPDPDAPGTFYDYRAAWKAGAGPDNTGHWPSEFKKSGHPRFFVNTQTSEGSSTAKPGFLNTVTGQLVPVTQTETTVVEDTEIKPSPQISQQGLTSLDPVEYAKAQSIERRKRLELFAEKDRPPDNVLNRFDSLTAEIGSLQSDPDLTLSDNLVDLKNERRELMDKYPALSRVYFPDASTGEIKSEDLTLQEKRNRLLRNETLVDALETPVTILKNAWKEMGKRVEGQHNPLTVVPQSFFSALIDTDKSALYNTVKDALSVENNIPGAQGDFLKDNPDAKIAITRELGVDPDKITPSEFQQSNTLRSVLSDDEYKKARREYVRELVAHPLFGLDVTERVDGSKDHWAGNLYESGTRGWKSAYIDRVMFDYMSGALPEDIKWEDMQKLRDDFNKLTKADPVRTSNFATSLLNQVAEIATPMAEGMAQGALLQGVGVPAPIGSGQYWFRQGSGMIFEQMMDQGVDEDTARKVASVGGAIYAAIELLQVGKAFRGSKGLIGLISKGGGKKESLKIMLTQALKNPKFLKTLGTYVGGIGEQALEEAIQKIVESLSVELGKAIDDNAANDTYKTPAEIAGESWNEFWAAAPAFAVLNLVGLSGNLRKNSRLVKTAEAKRKQLLNIPVKERTPMERKELETLELFGNNPEGLKQLVSSGEFKQDMVNKNLITEPDVDLSKPVEVSAEVVEPEVAPVEVSETGDVTTLDKAYRQDLADLEANEDMTDTERDLAVKQLTANYLSLRSQLIVDQKVEVDQEVQPELPQDVTEKVEDYIQSLEKQLEAHRNLPINQQNEEVTKWMREEIDQMKEGRQLSPEQLLAIETTPKKVTLNFTTYILDKLKLRKKVARETRSEVVQNIGDVQKDLVGYIRTQQLPMEIKGKLLTQLRDLSKFTNDETRQKHLQDAIIKVDNVLEEHEARVSRESLKAKIKQLSKMALSPELKTLSESLLDSFNITAASEKTKAAINATQQFVENPNKSRAGLLQELGLTEQQASLFFNAPSGELVSETEIKGAVSRLRQAKIPPVLLARMKTLSQVALKDMTKKDIDNITGTIESIINQQSRMNQLREIQQRRANDKAIVEATDSVSSLDPQIGLDETLERDPFYQQLIKKTFKNKNQVLAAYRKGFLTPSAIAFLLDGAKANGPVFRNLIQKLRDGYKNMYKVSNQVAGAVDQFNKDEDIKAKNFDNKKGKNANVYILDSGENINLTKNERIALFLHAQNPDNLRHLLTSGFVFRDKLNREEPHRLTHNDLSGILNEMTEDEVKVANHISSIYDGILAQSINDTSLELNGYNLAEVKKYFPIATSALHSKYGNDTFFQDATMGDMNALNNFMIESSNFLKQRQAGADNAIILDDAMQTLNRSTRDVSRYHGFSKPLRETKAFLTQRGSNGKTLAGSIDAKFEPAYWDAIKTLPLDIEQGKNLGKFDKSVRNGLIRLSRGILGYNLGVAGLQAVSYGQALNEMPKEHWLAGLKAKAASYEEMGKWSPTLEARGRGRMSIAFGEAVPATRFKTVRAADKVSELGMKGIQFMDKQAIGRIWRGVESWVRADNPELSGDALWKEVAKRTEHVVAETQPTFETIDRPLAARDGHFLLQILMRFSSQLIKNYAINFKNEQGYYQGEKTKESTGKFIRHILLNRVLIPLIIPLLRLTRDDVRDEIAEIVGIRKREDEDEETYLARLMHEFGNANLASQGQLVGAMSNALRGWLPKDPVTGGVKDVFDFLDDTAKLAQEFHNDERYKKATKTASIGDPKWKNTMTKVGWKLANLSSLTGVSLRNIGEAGLAIPAVVNKVDRDAVPWMVEALDKVYDDKKQLTPEESVAAKENLEELKKELKLR